MKFDIMKTKKEINGVFYSLSAMDKLLKLVFTFIILSFSIVLFLKFKTFNSTFVYSLVVIVAIAYASKKIALNQGHFCKYAVSGFLLIGLLGRLYWGLSWLQAFFAASGSDSSRRSIL